ncbi:MAG TPA: 2-oxoacid:acceptor oxidoreductase family protein [Anaeromyxobacteraceae bacterium]|nr:2-oxoacid:acceptor oxidoreductase family protein [Anaeromyxobacteraceae bacterium]
MKPAISEPAPQMFEIRWHGRGGQGAVTAAKILADAAFRSGFAGVASAPSFGSERRGAPITASTRLSSAPVRLHSQVSEPDIVIVLDDTLLGVANAARGLRPGGVLIVNTARPASALEVPGNVRVVTADVSAAAQAAGLVVAGAPMVNTAILGTFAAATGLVSMERLRDAIAASFPGPAAKKNYEAAVIAHDATRA